MLTKRQTQFVDAYELEQNATKAAMAAGYAERYAQQRGSTLLRDPEVRAELERRGVAVRGPGRPKRPRSPRPELPTARVGTQTEHAALAWKLANSKDVEPKDRIKALALCATICGEIGPGRFAPPPAPRRPETAEAPSPVAPAEKPDATTPRAPVVRLVTNKADASLHG